MVAGLEKALFSHGCWFEKKSKLPMDVDLENPYLPMVGG
jgi:hypothetical protein